MCVLYVTTLGHAALHACASHVDQKTELVDPFSLAFSAVRCMCIARRQLACLHGMAMVWQLGFVMGSLFPYIVGGGGGGGPHLDPMIGRSVGVPCRAAEASPPPPCGWNSSACTPKARTGSEDRENDRGRAACLLHLHGMACISHQVARRMHGRGRAARGPVHPAPGARGWRRAEGSTRGHHDRDRAAASAPRTSLSLTAEPGACRRKRPWTLVDRSSGDGLGLTPFPLPFFFFGLF